MEVQTVTADIWPLFQSTNGKILNEYSIRKFVFLKGASKEVRPQVWQFLLGYWSPDSTASERQSADATKKTQYEDLLALVQNTLTPPDDWKIIEKDVLRTDRHLECFKSSDSPLLLQLTRILKAFSLHNSAIGYVQGMSDILTPLLLVLVEEHVVFWCFSNLIERRKDIFEDLTLSVPLNAVKQLCWYVDRTVFDYIVDNCGDEEWLFCYRMVLLDFKREFLDVDDVIALWERMWACHRSKHFPVLFAVAVLINYRSRIFSCSCSEDLMEMSSSLVRKMPFLQLFALAKIIMEQMKADEYCPHNIRYLISGEGYAPPPTVGFVRVRQRLSSRTSTAQLQNTWQSIFGPSSSTPLILAPTEIDREFVSTQPVLPTPSAPKFVSTQPVLPTPTPLILAPTEIDMEFVSTQPVLPTPSAPIPDRHALKKSPPQAPPKQGFLPKRIEPLRTYGQQHRKNSAKLELPKSQPPSGLNVDTDTQSLSVSFMGNKSDFADGGSSAYPMDFSDCAVSFDTLRSEPQLDFIA